MMGLLMKSTTAAAASAGCVQKMVVCVTFHLHRHLFIAIRDSLREVGDLSLLQRLRSWQPIDRHEAFNRSEESRIVLIQKGKQHNGRSLDVLGKLNACFKNNADESNNEKRRRCRRGGGSFLICCIKMSVDPCKWYKACWVAVLASISSTLKFCKRSQYCTSERKHTIAIPSSLSNIRLDVFSGRG